MTKQQVIDFFKDNKIVKVVFIKANGEEREMTCTRNLELIPEVAHPKTHKEIGDSLPVFDLDKMGWRSFRFDSLREIENV